MEVWGGIECTINRVNDNYFDQLEYSGHYLRENDIDAIAGLGIKKLRYPVLWEKHQPENGSVTDWTATEQKLLQIKQSGVEVIAGLVHHGSGPLHVNTLDASFADGLAVYAKAVAQQFPWINYYTPINEPLTTARFCGLYGIWYPHRNDAYSFHQILISECKATVLAMKAIREVNPDAKLVQTEDLGKTHSTPLLQYQADFENQRRWLGFDLLCGMVNEQHPLWFHLIYSGIAQEELEFFIDNPCPPDVLGINHYITSERFLDEDTSHYPQHVIGTNGKHTYADVETVRVDKATLDGPYRLLMDAWNRYQIPIAITEVHLHCTREEQLRWFRHVWQAAVELEQGGVNMQGVTSWALLGSFGWNKLLTQPYGDYEAGAFDTISGSLRPTALCKMISALAGGKDYVHPVLCTEGWWKHDSRIIYRFNQLINDKSLMTGGCQPIIITGKTGTLGKAFARICEQRHIHYHLLDRSEFDIANPVQAEQVIRLMNPWAIVNTAGFVKVDEAETDRDTCFLVNAAGPANLALLCERYGIKLMTFSTDLVFDGIKNEDYEEHDQINPLNIYGESKALAEREVLGNNPAALVIRTSAFFGPWDVQNFVYGTLQQLKSNKPLLAANDVFVSPTYVPDLVNTSLDLLIDDEHGIWHLSNKGTISWSALALEIARRQKLDTGLVTSVALQELDYKAKRPKFSSLKSKHGSILPSLDNAVDRYFAQQEVIRF